MENCLIIGNGLNRVYDNTSWISLIDKMAKGRGVDRECENIPLPLEFERIMNCSMSINNYKKPQDAYYNAKKYVAKMISKISLPANSIHNELKTLSIDSIITTNYDFLLENVYGISNPAANCKGKRSYISGCTSISNSSVEFYHPHGVISNPSTICLGFINYQKICSDIQKVIATKKNNKNTEMSVLNHLRKTRLVNDHWGIKLYDSNCAFIGFGLDLCEVDIWWLLSHRASIINLKIGGAEHLIKNNIVYYDIINNSAQYRKSGESLEDFIIRQVKSEIESRMQKEKYALLESMNVIVKTVTISDDNQYEKAYQAIIKDIRDYGIDKDNRQLVV